MVTPLWFSRSPACFPGAPTRFLWSHRIANSDCVARTETQGYENVHKDRSPQQITHGKLHSLARRIALSKPGQNLVQTRVLKGETSPETTAPRRWTACSSSPPLGPHRRIRGFGAPAGLDDTISKRCHRKWTQYEFRFWLDNSTVSEARF